MSLVHRRRTIAAVLLVAFAVAALGVPLDVPRLAKRLVERYPCESCSCGCDSAFVCWTNCCCHTMADRLKWAEREGVRPPEFALEQAQAQGFDITPWVPDAKPATVCQVKSPTKGKACCCCCQSGSKPASEASESPADTTLPRATGWQTAVCGGVLKFWLAVSEVTLPLPEQRELLPPGEWLAIVSSPRSGATAFAPPTPPPRLPG